MFHARNEDGVGIWIQVEEKMISGKGWEESIASFIRAC